MKLDVDQKVGTRRGPHALLEKAGGVGIRYARSRMAIGGEGITIAAATSSAMSRVTISASFSSALVPSDIITMQYGHAVAMILGAFGSARSTRAMLIADDSVEPPHGVGLEADR